MYSLTKEGEIYLAKGLPEKKLFLLLQKGPVDITAARGKIDNFDIALMWGKKRGFVEIKGGVMHLSKKDVEFPEERLLRAVHTGKQIHESDAAILLKRNLIHENRETLQKKAEKLSGQEITGLSEELIKTKMWNSVTFKPYNVEAPGKRIHIGKQQSYVAFLSTVRQQLVEMGFKEMSGPTIETEFWNFDALFQPQNHPSRDWTQTYSMRNPRNGDLPSPSLVNKVRKSHEDSWKYKWDEKKAARLMPRAHTTALSARILANKPEIPGKYFAIGRCYRPDVIDATHGVEFNQTEGIILGESLNMKNLLGILKQFAVEFANAEKVKFLPDYYPFTEPSVQLNAKHPDLGWIELGGAGIFREELTKPLGVDVPVMAWGLGIDRLAMFKLGIKDIRELFTQNIDLLRNSVV